MRGGYFEKAANILPFFHASEMEKAFIKGNYDAVVSHIIPIIIYSIFITVIAISCFISQMKEQ